MNRKVDEYTIKACKLNENKYLIQKNMLCMLRID